MINSWSNKDHTDKSTKKEALGTLFLKESFDQTANSDRIDKFLRKRNFCSKPENIKHWTNQNLIWHKNSNCKTELEISKKQFQLKFLLWQKHFFFKYIITTWPDQRTPLKLLNTPFC